MVDDQPARASEGRNCLAKCDATDDRAKPHTGTPGSFSSTMPTTIQRTGLFWSPTAFRAAALPLHNDGSGGWSKTEYDALQALK